jgi:hypothetical protein
MRNTRGKQCIGFDPCSPHDPRRCRSGHRSGRRPTLGRRASDSPVNKRRSVLRLHRACSHDRPGRCRHHGPAHSGRRRSARCIDRRSLRRFHVRLRLMDLMDLRDHRHRCKRRRTIRRVPCRVRSARGACKAHGSPMRHAKHRDPKPGSPAAPTDKPLRNDICRSWMPVLSLMAMPLLRAGPVIANPGSTRRAQAACPIESRLAHDAAAAPGAGGWACGKA